jgi:hypothetical protein
MPHKTKNSKRKPYKRHWAGGKGSQNRVEDIDAYRSSPLWDNIGPDAKKNKELDEIKKNTEKTKEEKLKYLFKGGD